MRMRRKYPRPKFGENCGKMKALMDDYTGLGTPDDKKEPQRRHVEVDNLDRIMATFKRLLEVQLQQGSEDVEWAKEHVRYFLEPDEINQVIRHTQEFEDHEQYTLRTGIFITELIRNSYTKFSQITLDLRGVSHLCRIGAGLDMDQDRPLELIVQGNVGSSFCEKSLYVNAVVTGDAVDNFGFSSAMCNYELHGSASDRLGEHSYMSKYHVRGDVGQFLGQCSSSSDFIVEGNAGEDSANNCHGSGFDIKGNVGAGCGYIANGCHIAVGTAHFPFGSGADYCLFAVDSISGKPEVHSLTEGCTFFITNATDAYNLHSVIDMDKNEMILI